MKQHRFILVGHGSISQSYVTAIAQVPDAEIVGVVGRSAERVMKYAKEHNIAAFGCSLQEVAVRSQATAAIICTPNAAHYEGVMAVSQLGLHCLCEKPLHISAADQSRMVEACKKHGVKLGVSYMRRFLPHIRFIKQLIDSGKMGKIKIVDVISKHFREQGYYANAGWHGTYSMDGGGPFIQQGSHMIDIALWLCGGYEEVVDARRFQLYHDIETEDHGYAVVRYRNGGVGMIEASTATVGINQSRIEISGTLGSLAADFKKMLSFNVPGAELPEFAQDSPLFVYLLSDFVNAVETDAPPYISGESASATTELIMEIYEKSGPPLFHHH